MQDRKMLPFWKVYEKLFTVLCIMIVQSVVPKGDFKQAFTPQF